MPYKDLINLAGSIIVSPPCLFVYGIPNKSNRVAKLKKIKKNF